MSGAPPDLQSAAVIVEQMDTMLAKEPRQMHVVTLKTGLASEVATRVKQLYQDQLKGKAKTSPADAIIMGDDLTSRLIIAAGKIQPFGSAGASQSPPRIKVCEPLCAAKSA